MEEECTRELSLKHISKWSRSLWNFWDLLLGCILLSSHNSVASSFILLNGYFVCYLDIQLNKGCKDKRKAIQHLGIRAHFHCGPSLHMELFIEFFLENKKHQSGLHNFRGKLKFEEGDLTASLFHN